MLLIICACAFGSVALLVFALTMKSEREMVRERMQKHASLSGTDIDSIDFEIGKSFNERILLPFLRKLSDIAYRSTPTGALKAIDQKLETAGRPLGIGPREFIGLRVLSIAVFSILGIVLMRAFGGVVFMRMFMMIILVFIGIILPDCIVQSVVNQRQSSIRRVLADTLDLLTVSVEAGLGLDGAMQRVVEKFDNPLSRELDRTLQEMRIGKLRQDALRDMANRVKVQELSSFVAAICQVEQLGVSIAKVLRVQGDTLRTVRSQRARELAAKLPVKLLFPLVFCIFPAIFIVIAGPAAVQLFRVFGK